MEYATPALLENKEIKKESDALYKEHEDVQRQITNIRKNIVDLHDKLQKDKRDDLSMADLKELGERMKIADTTMDALATRLQKIQERGHLLKVKYASNVRHIDNIKRLAAKNLVDNPEEDPNTRRLLSEPVDSMSKSVKSTSMRTGSGLHINRGAYWHEMQSRR